MYNYLCLRNILSWFLLVKVSCHWFVCYQTLYYKSVIVTVWGMCLWLNVRQVCSQCCMWPVLIPCQHRCFLCSAVTDAREGTGRSEVTAVQSLWRLRRWRSSSQVVSFIQSQSKEVGCGIIKGYSSQWVVHSINVHMYAILVVRSNCVQRSLITQLVIV